MADNIELIGKIKPLNGGSFSLVDAADIAVDDKDTRLTTALTTAAVTLGNEITNRKTADDNLATDIENLRELLDAYIPLQIKSFGIYEMTAGLLTNGHLNSENSVDLSTIHEVNKFKSGLRLAFVTNKPIVPEMTKVVYVPASTYLNLSWETVADPILGHWEYYSNEISLPVDRSFLKPDSHTFNLQVTNSQYKQATISKTLSVGYPIYYGAITNEVLADGDETKLSNTTQRNRKLSNSVYTVNDGEYFYYLIPRVWNGEWEAQYPMFDVGIGVGGFTKQRFNNTGNDSDYYFPININGQDYNYVVWRSDNHSLGNLKLEIT